jgi:hypothetical protein
MQGMIAPYGSMQLVATLWFKATAPASLQRDR